MKLNPSYFVAYFSKYYTPENFNILYKYNAIPASGCPTNVYSLKFYTEQMMGFQKSNSIRKICSVEETISAIKQIKTKILNENNTALDLQQHYATTVSDCQKSEKISLQCKIGTIKL